MFYWFSLSIFMTKSLGLWPPRPLSNKRGEGSVAQPSTGLVHYYLLFLLFMLKHHFIFTSASNDLLKLV